MNGRSAINTSARSGGADDYRFMARALRLAGRGLFTTDPNPRVGCVVVCEDAIVGEGWHERAGGPHAEIAALRAAGARARGACVYVTLEPCCHEGLTAPCVDALIKAGVGRVVAAMVDPNPAVAGRGLEKLEAAGISTATGILADQAGELNAGFIKRMVAKRPLVRLKIAASLDGRTALASGESQWITGKDARRDGHRWRARSSAVMTGIGTALADDPHLTARDTGFAVTRQPMRVVIDSALRLPAAARILQEDGGAVVFTLDDASSPALESADARIERISADSGHVDLSAMMGRLAELGCNEVLVEAGAGLNGALLEAGLVDEIIVYLAPTLLGDAGRGMLSLTGLTALHDRPRLRLRDQRRVGDDWRLIFEPTKPRRL